MNSPKFRVGDKVKVTEKADYHRCLIGEIVEVKRNKHNRNHYIEYTDDNEIWINVGNSRYINQDHLEIPTKLELIL